MTAGSVVELTAHNWMVVERAIKRQIQLLERWRELDKEVRKLTKEWGKYVDMDR